MAADSWKVPLADVRIDDADLAAVTEVYRSGWLSMGPQTRAFEDAFADYVGSRHALAVSSGTAALHLLCQAAGLGPGDEVIVPSMTFVATVNAIRYTGARPVFGDIAGIHEPWLSVRAAEALITPRTRAIMTMAYGGHPGELGALAGLAASRDLILLEDAAHAAGSRLRGRHVGTWGAGGAFSFFANKNLAIGEGGMVVTDDDALADRMRLMRSHGMTSLTWDRHRGHAASYDVVARGYNYRLDEPRAALGRARLARLEEGNDARRRLDVRYRRLLAGCPGLTPTAAAPEGASCAHHIFTAVVPDRRDHLRAALVDAGIQTSVHYPAVHAFSEFRETDVSLPVTEHYAASTVTLPLFPGLMDAAQDKVVDAVLKAMRQKRR